MTEPLAGRAGAPALLDDDEPAAVNVHAPAGGSDVVLTCEHAGRRLPRRVGNLGLGESDLERHIAWDIGAEAMSLHVSRRLDAALITQTYSRLVVDCNRPLAAADLVVERSEDTDIPGNRGLHAAERAARVSALHEPYHDTIAAHLDAHAADGRRSVLVAMHSFTPVYRGVRRPWHIGLLYNRDTQLAGIAHRLLAEERALVVGDNEPYQLSSATDYTVPVHGEQRGISSIEIEVRQDLIEDEAGQREWAERLADLLLRAVALLPS